MIPEHETPSERPEDSKREKAQITTVAENLIIVSKNFLICAMTADPRHAKSRLDVVFFRHDSSEHCLPSFFVSLTLSPLAGRQRTSC
jgi:hypothetical protein